MVNIAYIFSGHLRTIKKECFYLNKDIDIYIHTYDKLGYWSVKNTVNMNTDNVSISDIIKLFGEYSSNIKSIIIEKENSKLPIIKKYSDMMELNKVYYVRPFNFISMHMKRLSALEDFFEKCNKNYDIVFLLRPDYPMKFDLSSLDCKEKIYLEGKENYQDIPEWFSDFL